MFIVRLLIYTIRTAFTGLILKTKLFFRVKFSIWRSYIIRYNFINLLYDAISASKLNDKAAIALKYSRPTSQTALYFTNVKVYDLIGWVMLILVFLAFWYFGLKALFVINWFYWFAYSNQLILCFLKYDIYWFIIYIYQYIYNFIVGTCFSILRTCFMAFNLDLFYMVLFENNLKLDDFEKLPEAIQRLFLEDITKESTIPWLRELEEKFIKSNEKLKKIYYPWKKQLKSNFDWISISKAFTWMDTYIFEVIRKLPKFNNQHIFDLILLNKKLQTDIYNQFDFFYKKRSMKLDIKKSKISDLKQAELYKIQLSKLQFYTKHKVMDEFINNSSLPPQKQLLEKFKLKQKMGYNYSKLQYKTEKSVFILDWALSGFWENFKTVTMNMNLQAKSQYMNSPVRIYKSSSKLQKDYFAKNFKKSKIISEDLLDVLIKVNPFNTFDLGYDLYTTNSSKANQNKKELAYKEKLKVFVRRLNKGDLLGTKPSYKNDVYKQKFNSVYQMDMRSYPLPVNGLHMLYSLKSIFQKRFPYVEKFKFGNILGTDNKIKTKRDIVKPIRYTESYEQLKNYDVDNVILDVIKHLMLLSARFFIFTKYMACNLKEFLSALKFKYIYIEYIYLNFVNKHQIVERTLKLEDNIKKLQIVHAFNTKVLSYWFNLFNTPLIEFSFWFSLLSWLFICIINFINKLFSLLPNFSDVLRLLWTKQYFNLGYDVTLFQMFNVYKELILFKLFSSNIFFEVIYNYCSYIYISLIQFFKFDVFNNIVFYWEQKYLNFSSAISNFHIEHFPADQENTFTEYHLDSTNMLIRGNMDLLEKSFYDLLNITTTTDKTAKFADILDTKLDIMLLWEDWLKVAVTNFRESVGVISYSRFWYFLPGFAAEFFPQMLDMKMHNMVVNPTHTSVYVFSLWHNALAKFYNLYKFQDFYTDFKNILEFFWFQFIFCLFNMQVV